MSKISYNVAVVIVNYNSHDLVVDCISSLKEHVSQELCFIVVDNSEQDETGKIRECHPDTLLIHTGENKGFAAGCNAGMRKAVEFDIQYILLLNPDTFAKDDFVAPLVEAMESDENVGGASPKIVLNNAEKSEWYAGAKMNWWIKGPVHLEGKSTKNSESNVSVPFVSGCSMLIRSSVIKSVGFMDENYFLYFEDADYCQRLIAAGWKLIFVPRAIVCHELSAAVGVQSEKAVYYISRNRIKFIKRWAKWYQFLAFIFYNTLIKLPGAVLVFGLVRRKPELVKAYFQGYWDGLKNVGK